MTCTAEVGMAETDYRLVAMLITGTIFIDLTLVVSVHIMGDSIRLGTQLDNTKG